MCFDVDFEIAGRVVICDELTGTSGVAKSDLSGAVGRARCLCLSAAQDVAAGGQRQRAFLVDRGQWAVDGVRWTRRGCECWRCGLLTVVDGAWLFLTEPQRYGVVRGAESGARVGVCGGLF